MKTFNQNVDSKKIEALLSSIIEQTGADNPNEAIRLIVSREWVLTNLNQKWIKKNEIIYFSVISDGATGKDWIDRLEKKGFFVDAHAKNILCSNSFQPTNNVIYNLAVFKGKLFNDINRTTRNIRHEAENYQFITSNTEIACLIREKFSDQELGEMGFLRLLVMHEPVINSCGDPQILGAFHYADGSWLSTEYGHPGYRWESCCGFVFIVSSF